MAASLLGRLLLPIATLALLAATPAPAAAAPAADPEWIRIPISVNGTATIGTQIVFGDFDKDGDLDLATAGKLGVHFIENLSVSKVTKANREATQPLNRQWPFPNEGKEVPQEDGPPVPND